MPVCNGWRRCTDDDTPERKMQNENQDNEKSNHGRISQRHQSRLLRHARRFKMARTEFLHCGGIRLDSDVYVIDYDTVIVTGYRPFGNVELPREVIDMLNKCAKSITRYINYDLAKIYLKNNLDELVSGIEYDFDSYTFASADANFEIKRK